MAICRLLHAVCVQLRLILILMLIFIILIMYHVSEFQYSVVHDCVDCMMEWTKLWPFTVSVCLLCCIVLTHAGQEWRDSTDNSLCQWTSGNSKITRTSRCCDQLSE